MSVKQLLIYENDPIFDSDLILNENPWRSGPQSSSMKAKLFLPRLGTLTAFFLPHTENATIDRVARPVKWNFSHL